jgi:putative ABC transport system permease protein
MFKPRWYKVFNDLSGNKARTLLIMLSIAVGLFAVGIILSARSILSEGLAASFAAIHPSSGTVRTIEPFGEDFLDSVRSMPEVQEADARRTISARVQIGPEEWKNITLFAFSDYNDIRVNKVTPESGEWPPPEREILIERAALGVIDAQIGVTLLIKLPNDTQRELRIAGTAHDPAQLPAQFDGTPYGYVSFDTLEWMGEPYGFNELHVIATHPEDKDWAQQVVNRVKSKAEKSGYTIPISMTAEPGQLPLDDVLQAILLLMGVLGLLSLFLSIFLIVNTVSAILAQQKRQIGVMKAIGGSSAQVFGMYLVMVIFYGVLALLVSIPLSMVGARLLSRMLATFFNFDIYSMQIPPEAILIQAVVGLLLPVLASIVPFLVNLRLSAAEAMSTYTLGKGRFGKSWIDRLLSGANLWFTRKAPIRPLLLSIRNTFRSKGRLALTLITLTLGAATFISVFSVRTSLSQTVDDMMQYFHFDIMLMFDRPYRSQKVQQEAQSMPGVTATDTWLQFPVRRVRQDGSESAMMYMFAPRADSSLVLSPALTEGRWLLPGDHNAVVVSSSLFKNEPDLHLGDEVVLKVNGQKHTFKIVGVSLGNNFGVIIYANNPYIAEVADRFGEADALMVTLNEHDAAYVEAESAALEKHFEIQGCASARYDDIGAGRSGAIFDGIVALLLVMASCWRWWAAWG